MKQVKKETKEKKEEPHLIKFLGLQLPLEKPLPNKDAKLLFFVFLIFVLLLAFISTKELLLAASGVTGGKAVSWIKSCIVDNKTRSP